MPFIMPKKSEDKQKTDAWAIFICTLLWIIPFQESKCNAKAHETCGKNSKTFNF